MKKSENVLYMSNAIPLGQLVQFLFYYFEVLPKIFSYSKGASSIFRILGGIGLITHWKLAGNGTGLAGFLYYSLKELYIM